jgi:periplasmic divalent cation tolerance protein
VEAGAAVVMTGMSSSEEAAAGGTAPGEQRPAACVQQLPMRSTYRWQGELRAELEVLLLIKTADDRVDAVVAHLEQHHPYDVPEVVVVRDAAASAPYLAWLVEETRPSS